MEEVTGVDSAGKLNMLRSIGADQVIDHTKEDFNKNGKIYDVIFDVIGKSSFSRSIRSLTQNGRYLLGNPGLAHMVRGRWVSRRSSKKVIFGASGQSTEDLLSLKELVERRRYDRLLREAIRWNKWLRLTGMLTRGTEKKSLVITVEHGAGVGG